MKANGCGKDRELELGLVGRHEKDEPGKKQAGRGEASVTSN
jgi:hypothetical protein